MRFVLRHREIDRAKSPLVMGVLNVTPDSFSDGGEYGSPQSAVNRALEMIDEGADIIDVGPESTRPGASDVSADVQIARAVPVLKAIRARNDKIVLSIDTRLAAVAQAAVDAGVDIVNDVSALRHDAQMAEVVASSGVAVVLMHMRGTPGDMQAGGGPHYAEAVSEIAGFLDERRRFSVSHGVDPARVILDPGIGFGKRLEHNLLILWHLDRFVALGQPLLVGASRKSFIGQVLHIDTPKDRLAGSLACAALATMAGAAIIRAHDVRMTVEVVRMCIAIRQTSCSRSEP